jgi:hypothetical protein
VWEGFYGSLDGWRGDALALLAETDAAAPAAQSPQGLLALRGIGKGLWGRNVGQTMDALREEWDDRDPA